MLVYVGMYVGMLVSVVVSRYYVRYSLARFSSMSISPAVMCRVDVEAFVCVASDMRCGAGGAASTEKPSRVVGMGGGGLDRSMMAMTRMIK